MDGLPIRIGIAVGTYVVLFAGCAIEAFNKGTNDSNKAAFVLGTKTFLGLFTAYLVANGRIILSAGEGTVLMALAISAGLLGTVMAAWLVATWERRRPLEGLKDSELAGRALVTHFFAILYLYGLVYVT